MGTRLFLFLQLRGYSEIGTIRENKTKKLFYDKVIGFQKKKKKNYICFETTIEKDGLSYLRWINYTVIPYYCHHLACKILSK